MSEFWCWRHPAARGQAGRCIGRTDLRCDPRKAKRLARRIQHTAKQHRLPLRLYVSPLLRARQVGVFLRRWGWQVHVDARLAELDFGRWDGQRWCDIARGEVDTWGADLMDHAPGGGETLRALARRVRSFAAEHGPAHGPTLLVSHAGWINTLLHVDPEQTNLPAAAWPPAPRHGRLTRWPAARLMTAAQRQTLTVALARSPSPLQQLGSHATSTPDGPGTPPLPPLPIGS